jgi:hypothetical protein
MGSTYHKKFDEKIQQNELTWIKQRRKKTEILNDGDKLRGNHSNNIQDDIKNNIVALALSGGGIRSATFNLGVLQGLEKEQQLKHIDIMSSVSGGGYIASSLTWFKSKLPKKFPFGTTRVDHNKLGGSVLSWLRSHSSFLTPGDGINKVSLFTAIFTGSFINLLIVVPLFVYGLYLSMLEWIPLSLLVNNAENINLLQVLQFSGAVLLTLTILLMILAAISTGIFGLTSKTTENLRQSITGCFTWGFLLFFIGSIPNMHHYYEDFIHSSFAVSLMGGVIILFSAKQSSTTSKINKFKSLFITLGLIIACFGFFMLAYDLAKDWLTPERTFEQKVFIGFAMLSICLTATCNINLVSMHGYYRNRLRDAFMPFKLPNKNENLEQEEHHIASWQDAQSCYLSQIPISNAPFHIINCNIELTGSSEPKYRNRAGDCFILSPLYCGSTSTGYAATNKYQNGTMDLASACAISGAAVATNTSLTRSKPLNFLMALLNFRLGYWAENPRQVLTKQTMFRRPAWFFYMFRDMFGQGLNEKQKYVHLSDGGHFENLGVYELVRRQCNTIISVDSGADPLFYFRDLAKLTELIRVDFGAKLNIDTTPLLPKTNEHGQQISQQAWVVGNITYQDQSTAKFIYIKSTVLAHLSADIYGYQRQNPSFPNQSTLDQFFDEFQFEAYRELGFQISHELFKQHPDLLTN